MKWKLWELSLLLALILTLLWGALLERRQQELSEQLIRLHVVAHSNGATDQSLKYYVRDRVRAEVEPLLASAANRTEAETALAAHLPRLAEIAEEAVTAWGIAYPVRANLTWERYPTRAYESFTLPAGLYRSLRVEIGEAVGQNWWCVVFPPLCLEAASGSAALEVAGLSENEVALIAGGSDGYTLRFRALEVIDGMRAWFG